MHTRAGIWADVSDILMSFTTATASGGDVNLRFTSRVRRRASAGVSLLTGGVPSRTNLSIMLGLAQVAQSSNLPAAPEGALVVIPQEMES